MNNQGNGRPKEEFAAALPGGIADRPADFDDEMYLRLNQDVAAAVSDGVYASGFEHYARYGAREGRSYRLATADSAAPAMASIAAEPPMLAQRPMGHRPAPAMPAHSIEQLRLSRGGGLFLVGWLDDTLDALVELRIDGDGWSIDLARVALARQRRKDVEAALRSTVRHSYGFWSMAELGHDLSRPGSCRVRLRMRSGASAALDIEAHYVPDLELRDLALGYLADGDFFGNPHHGAIASLDFGVGDQVIANTRRLTASVTANPYVERFGPAHGRPKGSIVVCLYGKPEYLFLQNTLFAAGAGIRDYELVYVCNSPELADRLVRDARIASFIHGLRQTLVVLNGNAGFGAANNVAVRYISSDRVIALNPDVVPLHEDWARRHTDLLDAMPQSQTTLFGAPLYYDDGSLMHGGMYLEIDTLPVAGPSGLARRDFLRVEHHGKGAPPDTARFVRARPVTAVTGAFISCRRSWFDKLEGFSEDFVLGHYEDADLCLRSIEKGMAPWLHDLRLYHLEGKGSTRLRTHEGGALVNRWLFSRRWAADVRNGLDGPQPSHPLLADPAAQPDPATPDVARPARTGARKPRSAQGATS